MGFAQGFQAGVALRQQKLAERQDAFNREQVFLQQNQAIADSLVKSATELQANAAALGKTVDLTPFRERLEGLVTSATAARVRQFGTDQDTALQFIDTNMSRFEASVAAAAAGPSAVDVAQSEGKAAAAGAVATAEALTEAGRPTGVTEAARGAGLLPEDSITVREINTPEGNVDLIVLNEAGETIRTIPGGPDVELTGEFGKKPREAAQARVLQTTELLRNTATLSGLLGDNTVGAVPSFKGFLNTTIAQFAPDAFDKDRANFERFTNITRQSALRVVSDESRFSEADREFIFDLFPKTGPFESEQNASVKLLAMQAFFLKRLGPDLTASGLDPNEFDTGLQPEVVRQATSEGFLNEDQAVRMLEMIWPELFGG